MALVERVSRSGDLEWAKDRSLVVPLHVVTDIRVFKDDVFRYYLGKTVPLAGYVNTPWRIVALRDVWQRVPGWVRDQDYTRERRVPRGGGGEIGVKTRELALIGTVSEAETYQ